VTPLLRGVFWDESSVLRGFKFLRIS